MFNYNWSLKDLPVPGNLKVFSCFSCGGGSSMGYKLAGYNVIGCNDIDHRMYQLYENNLKPKYGFLMPIQNFKNLPNLPKELYELDILDGSPPCSTFSITGNREKGWDENKKFREGQTKQVLSDLFFDFIDLAEKLNPKIIIAENVKGLLMTSARGYVSAINKRLDEIGYETQIFLLNAASMGVPQIRERVFFISRRKDLNLPKLELKFDEKIISFHAATKDLVNTPSKKLTDKYLDYWMNANPGQSMGKFNSCMKIYKNRPMFTIRSAMHYHHSEPRTISKEELSAIGSFPKDYNFMNQRTIVPIGMSVPPVMTAHISHKIKEQWFGKHL